MAYRAIDNYVYDRVRHFLVKRHKVPRAAPAASPASVFGEIGASCSSAGPPGPAAVSLAMKPVGKPDAGNPHVRFDERGGETE